MPPEFSALWYIFSISLLLLSSGLISVYAAKLVNERFWVFAGAAALQLGLISTITSLFHQLTPLAWLITQVIICGSIIAYLKYFTKFSFKLAPYQAISAALQLGLRSFWGSLATLHLAGVVALLGLVALVLLSGLVQYFVPITHPGYGDERMYHASRVLYWLQYQSVLPYITHNDRQVVFSFGGELFFLWPLLFTRTELIGRMVFWLGYPAAIVGLYTLLRVLKVDRAGAIVGVLIFAATPLVLTYSTGLKPDLWLAFFVIGLGFWVVQANENRTRVRQYLFWLGLFLMLSVNIKFTTMALILPVLALPWLVGLPGGRVGALGSILLGAALGLLGSGLIITFGFNWVNYDHILGPAAMRQIHASDLNLTQLYTHTVRLPLLLFELPVVPAEAVRNSLTELGNGAIAFLGAANPLPLEHSAGWPGYYVYTMPPSANRFSLAGMVWLPVLAIGLIGVIKECCKSWPYVRLTSLSLLIIFDIVLLFSIVFLIRWMTSAGLPDRFLVAPYALGVAIGVAMVSPRLAGHKIITVTAIILVLFMVYPSLRLQILRVQAAVTAFRPVEQLDSPFSEALDNIPEQARILFVGSQAVADYPLFAPRSGYSHWVVPWGKLPFDRNRLEELIKAHRISHVLIENDHQVDLHWDPPLQTSGFVDWLAKNSGFREVALATGRMRLFETSELNEVRWQELERSLGITQAPAQFPLITVADALHHQVGVAPTALRSYWPIEAGETAEQGFVWLGQGMNEGLAGVLWSREQRQVLLRFEVSSGPDQTNSAQTVQLAGLVNGRFVTVEQTFTGPTSLVFTVPLRPGRNRFYFGVATETARSFQLIGAKQPIAAGLHGVLVEPFPQ